MFNAADDPYLATPWVAGPGELLQYALGVVGAPDTDMNRRVGMVLIDNAVEVTIKVFLTLRTERGGLGMKADKVRDLGFWGIVKALEDAAPSYLEGLAPGAIAYLHEIRNGMYHTESGTTPTRDNVERYAHVARVLFKNLFGIEAPTLTTTADTIEAVAVDEMADEELDVLTLLRLHLAAHPGGEVRDWVRLRDQLSRQVWETDVDAEAALVVREAEELLAAERKREEHQVTDEVLGGRAKFMDRVTAVEQATYDLYEALTGAGTLVGRFGRVVNLVAPVLEPADATLLGTVVSWRNQLAHGALEEIPREWQERLETLVPRLEERARTLTDEELEEWRSRHHGGAV